MAISKTKQAIVDGAILTFSQNGYNTTMDEIALAAKVAKGTLYYHFSSKEELFNFIIKQGMEKIDADVQSATQDEGDLITRIHILAKVQLELVYENHDFFRVIMSQLWGIEKRQEELRVQMKSYIHHISNYFQTAIDAKIISSNNAELLAYSFIGLLTGTAIYELSTGRPQPIDDVVDQIINSCLNGILVK